jgi:hypothetical protein
MIIETIGFQKIYNVKSVNPVGSSVLNSEIVPLGVSSCTIIWLQN